jgi:hypothetical protein
LGVSSGGYGRADAKVSMKNRAESLGKKLLHLAETVDEVNIRPAIKNYKLPSTSSRANTSAAIEPVNTLEPMSVDFQVSSAITSLGAAITNAEDELISLYRKRVELEKQASPTTQIPPTVGMSLVVGPHHYYDRTNLISHQVNETKD